MLADRLHTCRNEPQPLDYKQLLLIEPWNSLLFTADGSLDVRGPI
jgi:hypothetical protein